jgi:hypothetical protein
MELSSSQATLQVFCQNGATKTIFHDSFITEGLQCLIHVLGQGYSHCHGANNGEKVLIRTVTVGIREK